MVDEVLAVGDAEFQKRCLGKLKEVSASKGRTILFVSHSMQAISTLCTRVLLLEKGEITASDNPENVINQYLASARKNIWKREWQPGEEAPGNEHIRVKSVELIPNLPNESARIDIRTEIKVRFSFYNAKREELSAGLKVFNLFDECIFDLTTASALFDEGYVEGECIIPGNFLNDGSYYISLTFDKDTSFPLFYFQNLFHFQNCLQFEVEDYRENVNWHGKWLGFVRPKFPFSLKQSI